MPYSGQDKVIVTMNSLQLWKPAHEMTKENGSVNSQAQTKGGLSGLTAEIFAICRFREDGGHSFQLYTNWFPPGSEGQFNLMQMVLVKLNGSENKAKSYEFGRETSWDVGSSLQRWKIDMRE